MAEKAVVDAADVRGSLLIPRRVSAAARCPVLLLNRVLRLVRGRGHDPVLVARALVQGRAPDLVHVLNLNQGRDRGPGRSQGRNLGLVHGRVRILARAQGRPRKPLAPVRSLLPLDRSQLNRGRGLGRGPAPRPAPLRDRVRPQDQPPSRNRHHRRLTMID